MNYTNYLTMLKFCEFCETKRESSMAEFEEIAILQWRMKDVEMHQVIVISLIAV